MVAGHPRFATRAEEFSVPVKLQNLDGSGKYIGASAVQGRDVYGHKVLRSTAIRSVFAPGSLGITLAVGSTSGTTIATVTGNTGSLYYKVAPATRATYGTTTTAYAGTLTSGTTEITATEGQVIEVVGSCI